MTNTMVSMGGMQMSFSVCVGEDEDESLMADPDGELDCTKEEYRVVSPQRVEFSAVCHESGSKMTMNGVFTGNFRTAYEGEIKVVYDPPMEGMRDAHMRLSAQRSGDCAPGQAPGSVTMEGMSGMPGMGGGNVDLNELMRNLQQMPMPQMPGMN